MKTPRILITLLMLLAASTAFASEPNAHDFYMTFVVNSFSYFATDGQCMMVLAEGDTGYTVQWRTNEGPGMYHLAGCPQHHSGERLQGRVKSGMKGYRVEILGTDAKGKLKVERWYVENKSQ